MACAESSHRSSVKVKYELRHGEPTCCGCPVDFIDDRGQAAGIDRFIGRRPVAAFGNSDGDFEIFAGRYSRRPPIRPACSPHRSVREYAYDYPSLVGQLSGRLGKRWCGWVVVNMKNDWTIFLRNTIRQFDLTLCTIWRHQ
jgi:hypothetical protein